MPILVNQGGAVKNRVHAVFYFALFAISFPLWAQKPQPFSADFSNTKADGEKTTGKIYFSPPNRRIDVTSMPEGRGPHGPVSVISNGATQTTYVLMIQQQMYMELHANSERVPPRLGSLQNLGRDNLCVTDTGETKSDCTKLGTETVNGRVCDKYTGSNQQGRKDTVWIDQKLKFPVKSQGEDGHLWELTNINEGAPDASLFKLPDGYRQFDASSMGGPRRPRQ
jgi:hypothetical protein